MMQHDHVQRTRRSASMALLMAATLLVMTLGGCAAPPVNPTFNLSVMDARSHWHEMRDDPVQLDRPVLVLGGIHDPGVVAPSIARNLRKVSTEDAVIVPISFFSQSTFESCREKVLRIMEETLPSDHADETVEVDVIGVSMGGLVARYAARRHDAGRRLRVRNLYTIATPHRGARMAELPTFDRRVVDMRAGSSFLASLNGGTESTDPQVFSYTRLNDAIVGAERAAPPGQDPWWVPNQPLSFAHLQASRDPRIIVDIAKRLRGDPPLTTSPPAPLPTARGTDDEP